MNKQPQYEMPKKYFLFSMLLFCLLPSLINCTLVIPYYSYILSDILLRNSVLSYILEILRDIFELVSFSVPFGFIIFSFVKLKKKFAFATSLFYVLTQLLIIPVRMLVTAIIYGEWGSVDQITLDVLMLTVSWVLQCVQLFIVIIFASVAGKKAADGRNSANSIKSFLNFKDPLLGTAFWSGVTVAGLRIVMRILSDIDYGAPESFGEVAVMAVYYSSDIVFGIVSYCTILLVLERLLKKTKKADEEDMSSSALDI